MVRVVSARMPCPDSRNGGALPDLAISSLANFMHALHMEPVKGTVL